MWERGSDRWKQKQRKVLASTPSPNWIWLSARASDGYLSLDWNLHARHNPPPSIPSTPNNPLLSKPALSDKRNEKALAYLAPTMPLGRVSEAWRRMHCLLEGVSFQQLINGMEAIVSCHRAAGARQAQIGWVQGKRQGARLLDGVELSHQDICFGTVFALQACTPPPAVVENGKFQKQEQSHRHFLTLHISKSKQTTLLHNLSLPMEYDLNIKHT